MVKTIKIFDPREFPFGSLSINYKDDLIINNVRYPTINKYIYSNMLKYDVHKRDIIDTKNKDIKERYNKLLENEVLDSFRKALENAINIKISNNKSLINTLIDTKNSQILYITDDLWLGTGNENNGLNLMGNYLMQKRRELILNLEKEKIFENKKSIDDKIYQCYIADILLNKAIDNEDDDLSKYMGLSTSEIINLFGGFESLKKVVPDKYTFLQLYEKNQIKDYVINSVDNNDILVNTIRKNKLKQLHDSQILKREYTVLDKYAEYTLEKEFPELTKDKYKQAIHEQYNTIKINTKRQIAKQLYDLYQKGMLSQRLSLEIDKALLIIKVPTEAEINKAESYKFYLEKIKHINSNITDYPETRKEILIFDDVNQNEDKYKPFCFTYHSSFINIDSYIYPTISHYVYTILIKNLDGYDMKKANNLFISNPSYEFNNLHKYKDPEYLGNEYLKIKNEIITRKMKELATIALDKKFENRNMQDVLLTTSNDNIIWNDFNNILGGKENFIGNYLMKLRVKIKEQRKNETFHLITEKEITDLLQKDIILNAWIRMRITDSCKTIIHMKNYINIKYEKDIILNNDFVEKVLDIIYQPCSNVFSASGKINAILPKWFSDIVRYCPGFEKIEEDVINLIWKRLVVMIWYLNKYLINSNIKNVRNALIQISQLSSSNKDNCDIITENKEDNCILSAIINLIKGIIIFNKNIGFYKIIGKEEVGTAVCIILNRTNNIFDKENFYGVEKNKEYKYGGQQYVGEEFRYYQEDKDYDEFREEIIEQINQNNQEYTEEDFEDSKELEYPEDDIEEDIKDYDLEDDRKDFEDFEDVYSPRNIDNFDKILESIPEIKDIIPDIKKYIIIGMKYIKNYKMSKTIKTNRINFFSSQR